MDDPEAVFAHEIDKDWCAPAGVQMTLAVLGLGDTSEAFQREIAGRVREWETWEDSHNYNWGPAAMASALAAYGAPGYEIRSYEFRGDCPPGAAIAIERDRLAGDPARLEGRPHLGHDRLPGGRRPDGLSRRGHRGARTSSTRGTRGSRSIWGPSDPPGTFQDLAEMKRNFLPWKRPEGAYPDRDGKWIVLVPTLPAPNSD